MQSAVGISAVYLRRGGGQLYADPAAQLMWPRLTSPIIARELLLSGRQVEAREALDIGLAVCPRGEELAAALELAKAFIQLPPAGIAATKRFLTRRLVEEFEELFAAMGDAGRRPSLPVARSYTKSRFRPKPHKQKMPDRKPIQMNEAST
jgi:enoyl-CoA hydratase/carnithine racemase